MYMKKYYFLLAVLAFISFIIVVVLANRAIQTDEYFALYVQ